MVGEIILKGRLDLKLPSVRIGSCVQLKEISSLDFEIFQENREKAVGAVWSCEA